MTGQAIRKQMRVVAGWVLHNLGAYRIIFPMAEEPKRLLSRRMCSYLRHYYAATHTVEAFLYIPELGVRVACDFNDHMLSPYLHGRSSVYELKEIQYFRRICRKGDHVLDIGANHGFFGMALAKDVQEIGRVYLAEANPTNLARLRRTVQRNRHWPVDILPYAVTDGRSAEVDFYLPRQNSVGNLSGLGSTVLHEHAVRCGYLESDLRITVKARSIDSLVDSGEIRRIDLLKVDVEGAEDAVFSGAERTMARFRPRTLMVETAKGSATFRKLSQLGYRAFVLDDAGRETQLPDGAYWGNVFFSAA